MKLICSLLIVASIKATSDEEFAILQMGRRLRDRTNLIDWLVPPRSTSGTGSFVSDIRFYGCWCLPGAAQFIKSRGLPVDALDAACKRASQCYMCARLDNIDRPKKCEANAVGYQFAMNGPTTINDPTDYDIRSIECLDDPDLDNKNSAKGANKYSCRRQICECDRKLAEDLKEAVDSGAYNDFFLMDNKGVANNPAFDPEATCKHDDNGLDRGELKCCGDAYSIRMPFYDNNGQKACCVNRTYNTLVQTCCDGNVVGGTTC